MSSSPKNKVRGGHVLQDASSTTISILDELLDYIKTNHLRITDVFKMLDVQKRGRIDNAEVLTQRFYEFQIVQSLEEVKRFIVDLCNAGDEDSNATSAFAAGSNSKARRGPGHIPSFSYDEFQKVLTFRRRYRPDAALERQEQQRHSLSVKKARATANGTLTPDGRRVSGGKNPNSPPRDFSAQIASRHRAKQEALQRKIEEKRMSVNEQQAAEVERKLKEEKLRRQQLTRELAVIQLTEIEDNLRQTATQEILSSLADSEAYYQHLEDDINQRFDEETHAIASTLNEEIAQISAIGHSGHGKVPQQYWKCSLRTWEL